MAIEGLEIAPGGIGSGEAQVFRTPFTERAFMMKTEQERVRKAQEEEQFANELAKIDVNGIHSPDAEDINKQYQALIDSYANVKNSRNRDERLKNKVLYEQKKKDLLMNIGSSKAYSKNLLNVGEKMLGSPEEWEDNSRTLFQDYKNNKSFGRTIDETQFRKKAKPADMIKIKDDIISYSLIENQSPQAGNLGGKAGVFSNTTRTLDPNKYTDGFVMKIKQEPGFYTDILQRYKSEYEKSPEYAKKGDDRFLAYAVTQEFNKDLAQLQKSSKSTFNPDYVPNNNNSTFNFGGGVPVATTNWGDPVSGTLNIVKTTNTGDIQVKTTSTIAVLDTAPVNVDFKFRPSEGYFKSDGSFIRSDKPIDIKSSRLVILPVVKGRDGNYVLVNTTTKTKTNKSEDVIEKNAKIPSGFDYVTFVEGVTASGNSPVFIPLESVPPDKIGRADSPAFKFALERNSKTSLKQVGSGSAPANNNTSTPQGRVR